MSNVDIFVGSIITTEQAHRLNPHTNGDYHENENFFSNNEFSALQLRINYLVNKNEDKMLAVEKRLFSDLLNILELLKMANDSYALKQKRSFEEACKDEID